MKLFDWLTGTKRPAPGVPAKTAAEVRADLLAVNRPTGGFGEVYRYKFSTGEIKTPLQDAVTKAGWVWRGVSFGKL